MLSLATCTIATCYQPTKRPELPIEPFRTTHASALRSVDQSLENKLSLIEEGWWRSTVVERRSLTGELSLSCARPAADG